MGERVLKDASKQGEVSLAERLGEFSKDVLIEEVISAWDELMRAESELVSSKQRSRALEMELASNGLDAFDRAKLAEVEEKLRVARLRISQLEKALENTRLREGEQGGEKSGRFGELLEENARLLRSEEEQMLLIMDMETQIDRLVNALKEN